VSREPRIVAELGRPETPQETADRRAAASEKRRANQTTLNLVLALVASLAIVAVLVLVVVRADAPTREPVDYATIGASADGAIGADAIVPALPDTWVANRAEASRAGSDGIAEWRIGFVTPREDYLQLSQAVGTAGGAGAGWLADETRDAAASGVESIGGLEWTVYDRRETRDAGNVEYALALELPDVDETVVLSGTADDAEFAELAAAVAEEIR
jgi:hypothetical protein